jgi:hypothetical protein
MRIEGSGMRSDAARTAIDRHAVSAVGQLLTSAIWLEHRVRRFSTNVGMFPSPRVFGARVVSSSVAQPSDRSPIRACS